jgi:hypothetical protein
MGPESRGWYRRLAEHGDGIALAFVRSDAAWFHDEILLRADGVLFVRGRPHFHHADGRRARHNSGAPVCLAAYGAENLASLRDAAIPGYLCRDTGRSEWGLTQSILTESAP